MRYVSTRGGGPALDFEAVTLAGLAGDGGLYVPEAWPRFSESEIAALAGLPYAQLAQRVMQPFVGDCLTPERLLELTTKAYGRFAHAAVTPLKQLDERQWVLELFHGPTLAFKDVALQLGAPTRKVAFAVPTGNFGDVFAGYVAAQMGLPIERLIVATNVNDILHRALSNGDYSAGTVTPTAAPSMDIQVSSNFERLLFDAGGRDAALIAAQMREFDATRTLQLTNAQRAAMGGLFTSARADADAMIAAQRWAYDAAGEVLDPHTAIALHAERAEPGLPADVPVVTLATAHPAKFGDAVHAAIGVTPPLPARVGDLFDRPERVDRLAGDYASVRDYVTARAHPRHG